jgi:stage II sporulation protein D
VIEEPAPEPVLPDVGIVTGEQPSPRVRVLILEPRSSVRVRVPNGFYLSEAMEAAPLKRFERGGDFTVSASSDQVKMRDSRSMLHEAAMLVIMPATDSNIYINGKPYRGGVIFRPVHGKVITVNYIDIEDYIKGVLPAEIGYLKPDELEAYRVQAIASRSYALSKIEERKAEHYDLQATIMDQVYRGVQGENPAASEAVDETAGVVGLWKGQLVRAYYSSCCGGHTADIRIGWPWKDPFPYLFGIRDSSEERPEQSFCRRSSNFRWRIHWSGGTLEKIIKKYLPGELGIRKSAIGTIADIEVKDTGPDGRVKAIEIVTDRGTYRVEGDRIRWVLRPNPNSDQILKSTLFKMDVKRIKGKVSAVNLIGGGNGHGIGMCQSGAIAMAAAGYSAEDILRHYYPGIMIRKSYK